MRQILSVYATYKDEYFANQDIILIFMTGCIRVVPVYIYATNVTHIPFPQVQTEDTMLSHTHLHSGNTTGAMCDAECQTDTMTPPRTSPAPSVENIPCSSAPAGQCTMVSAECQTDATAVPESSIAVGTEDTWSERGRQCALTLVSTECQTVTEPSELSLDVCVGGTKPDSRCSQTVRLAPCVGPSHHCGGALESSICIHRDETKKTVEKMENVREMLCTHSQTVGDYMYNGSC